VGKAKEPVAVLGVTRGLEASEPGGERAAADPVNLAGAARAGLYRMLQSEYARVRSRHVDLDPRDDEASVVEQIVGELAHDGDEPEVRHRAGRRERAVLREAPAGGEARELPRFAPDETLWIAGGTGGVGLALARHAVARWGVRRLVLAGRRALPAREEWEGHLDDGPIGRRLRALLELERAGVRLRVLALPLDDSASDELERAVGEVERELGPVRGVIHCAGFADREHLAFVTKPVNAVAAVARPKMTGLDTLVQCFKDHPLRLFVVCSSAAAAVPGVAVGQSDYAMANAYVDYLATARPHGLPLLSVQWPSWIGVGMGEAEPGPAYARSGLGRVSESEGTALMDYVLTRNAGSVVLPAIVGDADDWRPEALMGRRIELPAASAPVGTADQPTAERPARGLPTSAGSSADASPSGELAPAAAWVISLLGEQLHYDSDRLEPDVPIADYGTDSITMVQVLRTVGDRLGVELDPSALIEHPTVEAFVAWLADRHPAQLAAAFGGETEAPAVSPASAATMTTPEPEAAWAPATRRDRSGDTAATAQGDDIAVLGMAGQFPGAPDLDAYWRLLSDGRSAIEAVPAQRWGTGPGLVAGLIEREGFDPDFFLLPEADVAAMDPQALVLLEQALFALGDAGYQPAELKGRDIGVYIGARSRHRPDADTLHLTRNPIAVVGQNYLAANVSRFFDLQGPSVVIDTACSSSLVAMHAAVMALRGGDIEAAVVGGVTLLEDDSGHRLFDRRGVLSPVAAFHAFDRRAAGVVLGEGVGVVLLKSLERALADGDRVQAVLKGIAVNNDGRTAGAASPNPATQQRVMSVALSRSGHRADDVSYIEANAAGSPLHDLIELKALRAVYRPSSGRPCTLGSVKPNIGHAQCAEGIAGFIKVVLMLRNRQQVPFLSGQEPPAHFDLAASPFEFVREVSPWPDAPLVAAVSCFADGGTNAHAVIEGWTGAPGCRAALPRPRLNRRPVAPARGIASHEDAAAAEPAPSARHVLVVSSGRPAAGAPGLPSAIADHYRRAGAAKVTELLLDGHRTTPSGLAGLLSVLRALETPDCVHFVAVDRFADGHQNALEHLVRGLVEGGQPRHIELYVIGQRGRSAANGDPGIVPGAGLAALAARLAGNETGFAVRSLDVASEQVGTAAGCAAVAAAISREASEPRITEPVAYS
jgi:polyketide synthase PksJ